MRTSLSTRIIGAFALLSLAIPFINSLSANEAMSNPGPAEYCLHFDGTDDYAIIPDFPFPSDDFTIEVWVKPESFNSFMEIVFGFDNVLDDAFQLRIGYNGELLYGENPPWSFLITPDPCIVLNQWNYVAISRIGSLCRIFINGEEKTTAEVDQDLAITQLNLGGRERSMDRFFAGQMDELRIWSRGLDNTELLANMDQKLNGDEPGLTGYWPFDEGAGNTVSDYSGLDYHGSLGDETIADVSEPTWAGTSWPHTPGIFRTLLVKQDGTGDYTTIQEAIDGSNPGENIKVYPGTYYENINFHGKLIALTSLFTDTGDLDYIQTTIIDGSNSGRVITFDESVDHNAVVEGFTITNGQAPDGENGGGIYLRGASPIIRNCIISNNNAPETGGGIYAWENSDVELEGVKIIDNYATRGAGLAISESDFLMDHCIIAGNTAVTSGGGMSIVSCSNRYINFTTISGNIAPAGSAIILTNSSVNLWNSILWGTEVQQIYFNSYFNPNTLTVAYSDVQGGESSVFHENGTLNWGDGNIDTDPLFVDPDVHDYNLAVNSPCIDAGNPGHAPDPDGTPADMGALPYFQSPQYFGLRMDGSGQYGLVNNFPLPEEDMTIETWIKPDQFGDVREILFASTEDGSQAMQLRLDSDGRILYGEHPVWHYIVTPNPCVVLNTWNHLAITRQGGLSKIYFNGAWIFEGSVNENIQPTILALGGRHPNNDRIFSGLIDEVKIWNRALSDEELNGGMYQKLTGTEVGLTGYWQLDEGSGQTISDLSPNAYSGFLGSDPGPDAQDPTWEQVSWPHNLPIIADFDADTTEGEAPLEVVFKNLTTGAPATFEWVINPAGFEFINGTDATSRHPEVRFTANGLYTIQLTASTGDIMDIIIKTEFINIRSIIVGPLINNNWPVYTWPYNAYYPVNEAGINGHLGNPCGPTAMSRIMHYWAQPANGIGSFDYIDGGGNHWLYNLETMDIDYTNMPYELPGDASESEYQDVAKIFMACATVGTNIEIGAGVGPVPQAWVDHFNYELAEIKNRWDYTREEWITIFKNELDNGRPILIEGRTEDSPAPWESGNWSGHYFVCDGYDSNDRFNINYSIGNFKGFFDIDALGEYSAYHKILTGFEPNNECASPEWSVDPTAFAFDGEINFEIMIDDNFINSGGIVAAFVNDECRGVKAGGLEGPSLKYVFPIRVYSNQASGEVISFKYFDEGSCTQYDVCDPVEFIADMQLGDALNPIVLTNHCSVEIQKDLSAGWTWFSLNVEDQDMTVGTVLGSLTLTTGDYIKNQTVSATYYDDFGWFGELSTLNVLETNKIRLAEQGTLQFEGTPVDPAEMPIPVSAGWNWIGYTPQLSIPINEALESINPMSNDYIKNQTVSGTYYDGFGWFGELTQMDPLEGYMLKSGKDETLTYPDAPMVPLAKAQGKWQRAKVSPQELNYKTQVNDFNASDFEYSGQVNAEVFLNGEIVGDEEDMLITMSEGRVVGNSSAMVFPPSGLPVFSHLAFENSEENRNLEFYFFDLSDDQWYKFDETLEFEPDMIEANAYKPFRLEKASMIQNPISDIRHLTTLNIYPNPATNYLNINLELTKGSTVILEILDPIGRLVDEIQPGILMEGSHQFTRDIRSLKQGYYLIRIKNQPEVFRKVIISH